MTMTTSRPVVPFDASEIPTEMRAANRWLLWRPERKDDGTYTKVPVSASAPRFPCDKTNPLNWTTFDTAVKAWERYGEELKLGGLGFALGDRFVGIDFDNCVDPETREITNPEVAEWIEALDTYFEYSPSATGLRGVVRGELPGSNLKTNFVEMWGTKDCYATFTGCRLDSAPATAAPAGEALIRLYERAKGSVAEKSKATATGAIQSAESLPLQPATPRTAEIPDAEVIRTAEKTNKKFATLWGGGGDGGDKSRGDMSLANFLAYYCGPNGESQVERLMRSSGRMRDKFNERRTNTTYLGYTIAEAYRNRSEYFVWSLWNDSAEQKPTSERHREKPCWAEPEASPAGEPACGAASFRDASSLTDVGLARRLALHARGTLRYVEETKEWIGWSGKQWKRDSGLRAHHVAKRMTDAMWREWVKLPTDSDGQDKRRQAARRFAEYAASARGINAAVSLARGEPEIIVSAEELDRHPMLLNVRNGVVDLDRRELLPHDPKYLITQMANVTFDPQADCPRWRQFLGEVTAGDYADQIAPYLQRLAGLCLTGDVSDHVVNFFFGAGSNGKSVFVATLCELLGTYAATAPAELLMSKGQRSREAELLYGGLVGRRLVTITENELGTRLNEATVKQLCGGDKVLWRRLYADPVEATPTWKLVACANHKPTVRGSDNGIWRRFVPVPWRNSFVGANADPRLAEKLRGELSGILNWAIVGLGEWRRRGGLEVPECLRDEQKDYRAACDVLGQWMAERCITTPGAVSLAGDLFRSYSDWCTDRGENAGTGTSFGIELERLGFRHERPTGGTYRGKTIRHGIGLLHGCDA